MNELTGPLAAAAELEAFCKGHGWRFCFIGGIAVQRWGAPRFTQDVDLTLLTGFGGERQFVDTLLDRFRGRLSNTRLFALERRVLLLRTAGGVPLDISLSGLPFEEASIERATPWKIADALAITTCSAEDLVIYKVFAARDRDWSDVESVLARRHGQLNLAHIRRELAPLLALKGDPAAREKLERMIAAVDGYLR